MSRSGTRGDRAQTLVAKWNSLSVAWKLSLYSDLSINKLNSLVSPHVKEIGVPGLGLSLNALIF